MIRRRLAKRLARHKKRRPSFEGRLSFKTAYRSTLAKRLFEVAS